MYVYDINATGEEKINNTQSLRYGVSPTDVVFNLTSALGHKETKKDYRLSPLMSRRSMVVLPQRININSHDSYRCRLPLSLCPHSTRPTVLETRKCMRRIVYCTCYYIYVQFWMFRTLEVILHYTYYYTASNYLYVHLLRVQRIV